MWDLACLSHGGTNIEHLLLTFNVTCVANEPKCVKVTLEVTHAVANEA